MAQALYKMRNEEITMKIFDIPKVNLIKKSLDVYNKQHQAISKNIAHANDKNYKRIDTDFSRVLKSASDSGLKTTHAKHIIPSGEEEIFSLKSTRGKGSVDFTEEMGDLAVNQIKFEFSARMLRRFYESIGTSIRGRIG